MFRTGAYKAPLEILVARDQLCIHPFLIAELALGSEEHGPISTT
jgi:hypothetical protein